MSEGLAPSYNTPKGTRPVDAHGNVIAQPGEVHEYQNTAGGYVLDLSREQRLQMAQRFLERRLNGNGKNGKKRY